MSDSPERAAPRERTPIDPRGPRFGATITALLLLADVVLAVLDDAAVAVSLLGLLGLLFAWGAFAGIERHPYGVLYRRLIRPRLGPPPELEDPRPPSFAQGVGLVFAVAGVVAGLLGATPVLVVAAGAAFVAAALNASIGFCLGCQVYLLLLRAGLIPGRTRTA